MQKVLLICSLCLYFTTKLYAQINPTPIKQSSFKVAFAFNGFEGDYFIDTYTPLYSAKTDQRHVFNLSSGDHTFGVGGYPFSEISFNIDTAGKVTLNSNKSSARIIGPNTISLQTCDVFINSGGAPYSFSAFHANYPGYIVKERAKYKLIKGFTYYLASNYSGDKIVTPKPEDYPIPELFFFSVDSLTGNVSAYNEDPVSKIAATYLKNTLTLNTVEVKLTPQLFKSSFVHVDGYSSIPNDNKYILIKGLGNMVHYDKNGLMAFFYFIPM